MSDYLLNIVIILAELGAVLFTVLVIAIIFYILRSKKEGKTTRELIKYVKAIIPKHREKFTAHFKENTELKDNEVESKVEALINNEKKLYQKLINISVNKDTSLLKLTLNDINTLVNDYIRMLTVKGSIVANDGDGKESQELILRKESDALRIENISLKKRLDAETATIETMMGELSAMYEGGNEEGQQRTKNEMYKLERNLDAEEENVKTAVSKTDEIEEPAEVEEVEEVEAVKSNEVEEPSK